MDILSLLERSGFEPGNGELCAERRVGAVDCRVGLRRGYVWVVHGGVAAAAQLCVQVGDALGVGISRTSDKRRDAERWGTDRGGAGDGAVRLVMALACSWGGVARDADEFVGDLRPPGAVRPAHPASGAGI